MGDGIPARDGAGESTQRLASTRVDDAPTVVTPAPRTSPRLDWQIGRAHRMRRRLLSRLTPPARRWPWVAGVALVVLIALVVPSLLAVASALGDYSDIRALGQDGLHHLLAAKADLAGLGQLESLVSLSSGASASNAPYTLLVQRQAGTFYTSHVSIQPSPKMRKAHVKAVSSNVSLGTNTAVSVVTPQSAPSAPAPTPTPTATPSGGKSTPTTSLFPDPKQLQDAETECRAAQQDFQALQTRLDHLGWALSLGSGLAPISSKVDTARALATIGYDAATLGVMYAGGAIPLLSKLRGTSLTGNQAVLSQSDINAVEKVIAQSQPLLNALQGQLDQVDVSSLPLSDAQKAEFTTVKADLPKLRSGLGQADQYLNALGWLLGTDHPRNYLLETLDRTELRASGGFIGDFANLNIQNGKIAPISLVPVARTDYGGKAWYDGWNYGRRPPAQYSWWPIANWGLRDSNLAADYPSTAQLSLMSYQGECGAACQAAGMPNSVDGVIQVTPVAIEHILQITGPLAIPDFNTTVTAANLEFQIHYFSLQRWDGSYPPGPNGGPSTDRKTFFYDFGHALEDRLRHLSSSQFVSVARQMLIDVRAKDIQIYVTNPSVESLLTKLRMSGAIEKPAGEDTFLVDQVNTSATKANPCVNVTQTDNVALDDKGGATHHLTVSMYHQGGAGTAGNCDPWFDEFSTYHAYMRVYAPASAQLQSADGFDQNVPMCPANCSANPYPGGELVCPPGGYDPGVHTPTIKPMGAEAGVLDKVGGPTQTTSDVPGTAMWGGFVVIPPYCTANLTLTWYVPGVVRWPLSSSASASSSAANLSGLQPVAQAGERKRSVG